MKRLLYASSLLLSIIANAQQSSIRENFEGAVLDKCDPNTCPYADFPYNGWTSNRGFPYAFITMNSKQNKYLKTYSFFSSDPTYFFTPELVSTEGNLSFQFNGSEGKLEVGTITDKTDFSTFLPIKEYEIQRNVNVIIKESNPLEISKNEAKYIAFKFTPAGMHKTFGMDTIIFTPKTLSTNEFQKKTELKFAIDLLNHKLVFSNDNLLQIRVFSANGSLIINEKMVNNDLDISRLSAGTYIITAETIDGKTLNAKFIKK